MVEVTEDVVIVGAGIAGLATAVALKRVGIQALVLERSESLRATGAALSLFPNAWLALEALGVAHKLTSVYNPTNKGFITNVPTGTIQEVNLIQSERGGCGPRSIHRKALLEALAQELPADTIRFSTKITSFETQQRNDSTIVLLRLEDQTIIKSKILIGCDGVHSMVAQWLGLAAPVNSGRWAARGLSVYPQGHGLRQEVQQFIDAGLRGGFVPLNDKELYWFITTSNYTPKRNNHMESRGQESIQREIMENIAKHYPPVYLDVVRHSDLSTLTWAPLMLRLPWHLIFGSLSKGVVTLAGDAMHPMTPDLGQGGCSALEDAVVLGRHIGETFIQNQSLEDRYAASAIEKYVKERKWRAVSLITGSYLSGWAQQGGSGWWMKFFRDVIFYRFLYHKLFDAGNYDCGKLPLVSSPVLFETENK